MLRLVSFARHNGKRIPEKKQKNRGSIAIIAALSFVPMSLIFAVVIDAGRSWVVQTRLQNGIEAGAVAAAQTWMTGGASCQTSSLGIVSANGAVQSTWRVRQVAAIAQVLSAFLPMKISSPYFQHCLGETWCE